MTTTQALKRTVIDYSPLSGTIRLGVLNSEGKNFLEHKDITEDAIIAVALLLEEQRVVWGITRRSDGQKLELRLVEVDE